MFHIKILNSISDEIIRQVTEIDHKTFPPEDWITEEDADMIYSVKNDCLIVLYKSNEPIGFATVFKINQDLIEHAIETDTAFYQLLTPEILSDECADAIYGYCFSILPQYRGQGLIYALYKGLKIWLELKTDMNDPMYAEAVSDDGLICLNRLGFHTIHDYTIGGKLQKAVCVDIVKNIERLLDTQKWTEDIPVELAHSAP